MQACQCRQITLSDDILQGFLLHKYRVKNKRAKEGASGGWRFFALFDKGNSVLYPIIVYPKKAWSDAGTDLIKSALAEIIATIKNA